MPGTGEWLGTWNCTWSKQKMASLVLCHFQGRLRNPIRNWLWPLPLPFQSPYVLLHTSWQIIFASFPGMKVHTNELNKRDQQSQKFLFAHGKWCLLWDLKIRTLQMKMLEQKFSHKCVRTLSPQPKSLSICKLCLFIQANLKEFIMWTKLQNKVSCLVLPTQILY